MNCKGDCNQGREHCEYPDHCSDPLDAVLIVSAVALGMACFGSITYLAGRVLGVW
jgi:hypothetical protein